MEQSPTVYLPIDRLHALAQGTSLPERAEGSVLFADISGFTPLTEALAQALGPRRGAEELTRQLNLVYDALIGVVEQHGGSVVGFAGDAITCWFAGEAALPATACALVLQRAMRRVATIPLPGGGQVELAMKVAVASGPVRRFIVGDPAQQLMDVLAGETLARMAQAEHLAERDEVLVDEPTAAALGERLEILAWRTPEAGRARFALVGGLRAEAVPTPWPPLATDALREAELRPWLLPIVYERLQAGQGEFLTELRPAVALFLRFAGIEYDEDEAAGEKLDAFVRWVQEILGRYGGSLIQLTIGEKGSYLYATFGAPIAHEDDARRAVAAALELRRAPEVWPTIQQVRLGISLGTMRSGAYGSATRRSYGVLGDEVNLTARLMQHAASGQILGSARVQQATSEHFIWRAEPAIRVKGKLKPIVPFALLRDRQQQPIHLQERAYALPMVGREAELRLVDARLAQALAGEGQIVGITAEAGVGKSRLVAEIIRLADERGLMGYRGECQSYGSNTPYLVWQPIWRAFFGIDPEEPIETQIRALALELERLNPEFLPRLPLLGTVLALPIPENDLTRSLEPSVRKASREALLVDCLKLRAARTPLLLVLEDLHWLDPLSHDLLEEVGRVVASLPVLLILAYRPLELTRLQAPRLTKLPNFIELPLADFTVREAEQLIEAKLSQLDATHAHVPPEVVEQLMARAQGNPFYIEELLNLLHDRGLDPLNAQALTQTELPTSLHSLILSRIDQLSERQKITLKVASVIGRLFRAAWLYGYYPSLGEPGEVKADLEVLNRLDLTPLDSPEPELTYLFKHIVTQEVAYESLAYATRALLHEQLARYLEALMEREAHPEAYVDLLAYHYERSENIEKKREYLRRAAEMARATYANEAAIEYYERLLPLLRSVQEEGEARLALGGLLELAGRLGEAEAHYSATLALTEAEDALHARSQRAMGSLRHKQGNYDEALTWLEQARAAFAALDTPAGQVEVSRALTEMGTVYRERGDYRAARTYLEESLRLARASGDSTTIAHALNQLGNVAWSEVDYASARAHYEESLDLHQEMDNKMGVAVALGNLGNLAYSQGDYEQARVSYEAGITRFRAIGAKRAMAITLRNLGAVVYALGEYDAAQQLAEESLALRREMGDRWGTALSLDSLASVALAQGDYERARHLFEECLALFQETGHQQGVGMSLTNLGLLLATQGERDEARRYYRAGLEVNQTINDRLWSACGLVGLAALEIATQPFAAARLLGATTRLLERTGMSLERAYALLHAQSLATLRATLDDESFARAWAEGQALALDDAIAEALG